MTTPEQSTQVTIPPLPVAKRDSALAITSLVSGLLGWTFIPIIGAVVAIITGHLAKKEIRDSGGTVGGDGMALAGLILGYVELGLILLAIICIVTFVIALVPAINNGFDYYSALLPAVI